MSIRREERKGVVKHMFPIVRLLIRSDGDREERRTRDDSAVLSDTRSMSHTIARLTNATFYPSSSLLLFYLTWVTSLLLHQTDDTGSKKSQISSQNIHGPIEHVLSPLFFSLLSQHYFCIPSSSFLSMHLLHLSNARKPLVCASMSVSVFFSFA